MTETKPIRAFRGQYGFLSNFSPDPIEFRGRRYWTSEAAYQAAKTDDPTWVELIASEVDPGKTKKMGRNAPARDIDAWNRGERDEVMLEVLRAKFAPGTELAQLLLDTGERELVEGNNWGDRHFGEVNGEGENMLGILLMQVRGELRATLAASGK